MSPTLSGMSTLLLEFIKQLSEREDSLFYYFHTKGISYQSLTSNDRLFCSFKTKIEAWREMLEYFIFDKWKVAVNVLMKDTIPIAVIDGHTQLYNVSGSFWWARSAYYKDTPKTLTKVSLYQSFLF